MEYKIGEVVTLPPYDTKAEVVEVSNDGCEGCYYSNKTSLCYEYMNNGVLGECWKRNRSDKKTIIYKKLE